MGSFFYACDLWFIHLFCTNIYMIIINWVNWHLILFGLIATIGISYNNHIFHFYYAILYYNTLHTFNATHTSHSNGIRIHAPRCDAVVIQCECVETFVREFCKQIPRNIHQNQQTNAKKISYIGLFLFE